MKGDEGKMRGIMEEVCWTWEGREACIMDSVAQERRRDGDGVIADEELPVGEWGAGFR